jgi:acetyl esterase/lipase
VETGAAAVRGDAATTVHQMPEDAPGGLTRRRLLAGGVALGIAGVAASCGLFDDSNGPQRFAYGDDPAQFSELFKAKGTSTGTTVVMIHGGSWSDNTDRRIMHDVARDLAHHGIAVWNIEYRCLGQPGGGYPGTFADVAAAIDDVAKHPTDVVVRRRKLVVVGHSAGGQLALWAAARAKLPAGAPGADPRVRPHAVVAMAPVSDLVRCANEGLIEGTCAAVLGGSPTQVPDRYAQTSPQQLVPMGVPQRLFHGTADTVIPIDYSRAYVAAATAAGDDASLTEQAGANHFTVLQPSSPEWIQVRQTIVDLAG